MSVFMQQQENRRQQLLREFQLIILPPPFDRRFGRRSIAGVPCSFYNNCAKNTRHE